ncbi:hypothetical protein EVAR_95101_1 [Eumeta japonica]|uniref:Uncharacterized protein n=1 Tax=Eumeta variegata TaxID=151549 RepID=A0A4C1W810_EUMVA|nr:hypothetical protein EVAR_95101_1 [Eumeta japonica]
MVVKAKHGRKMKAGSIQLRCDRRGMCGVSWKDICINSDDKQRGGENVVIRTERGSCDARQDVGPEGGEGPLHVPKWNNLVGDRRTRPETTGGPCRATRDQRQIRRRVRISAIEKSNRC